MRYVLDCSVAIKLFVPEADSDLADRCLVRQQAGELSFLAPDVLIAEVGHTLRKHVLRGALTPEDAHSGLAELLSMQIELFSSASLAREALTLALAHSGSFYDALYMALAQRDDLRVLTADQRMVSAFAALGRSVPLQDLQA